jgi:hypothetical protein
VDAVREFTRLRAQYRAWLLNGLATGPTRRRPRSTLASLRPWSEIFHRSPADGQYAPYDE